MGKTKKKDDVAMRRIKAAWQKLQTAGWTQQRLGEAMGYPSASARKSVNQFLRSKDPTVSVVRRFARAVGVRVVDLVGE